ncbi:MAG: hypothetical protein AAF206_08985, partial [Bacteroidota bacterium]
LQLLGSQYSNTYSSVEKLFDQLFHDIISLLMFVCKYISAIASSVPRPFFMPKTNICCKNFPLLTGYCQ